MPVPDVLLMRWCLGQLLSPPSHTGRNNCKGHRAEMSHHAIVIVRFACAVCRSHMNQHASIETKSNTLSATQMRANIPSSPSISRSKAIPKHKENKLKKLESSCLWWTGCKYKWCSFSSFYYLSQKTTVASIHPSDCLKTIFSWNRRRQEWPSLHDDLKIWRLSHQTFSSMKGFFSYSNFTSMEGTMWTWTKLEHSTCWKNNGYLDVRGRSLSTGGTPNPTKWQDVVGHDLILSKTGSWNGLLSAK
jgi:hypothetical protein